MNLALPTAIPTALATATNRHFSFGTWLRAFTAREFTTTQPCGPLQYADQEIARNGILEVKQPLGVTIECLEGSVWITLDSDSRDVVLDAGQAFRVDRNERTLVQALTGARIRLTAPACMP